MPPHERQGRPGLTAVSVAERRRWLAGAASLAWASSLAGCAGALTTATPPVEPPPPSTAPAAGPLRADPSAPAPVQAVVRPPRLRPGDTVGLFAASSRLATEHLNRARSNLEALGFRVRLGRHPLAVHGHYAGTAEQRVEDFHALWRDPDVRALWALRGGAGAAAMLPLLDWSMLRQDPKPVIGFSDTTALLLGIRRRAGLVCFHGPTAVSVFSPYTRHAVLAVLTQASAELSLARSAEHRSRGETQAQFRARQVRPGSAEGVLVGGNLSVLASLVGTPWAAEFEGAVLFLEEVGELPYRVDRLLTQLQQSQGLERSAALMGGVFERCEAPPGDASMPLASVIDARFGSAGVPAVYGWSFGHVRDQMTLPLGVRARLDTASETLTLLEPAVS